MIRPMVPVRRFHLALSVLISLLVWGNRASATTADEICPPTADPCQVVDKITVTNLSVLDFGTRTVIVRKGGRLDVGAGEMTILAGKLTIDSGGGLRAQPRGTIKVIVDGQGLNDGAVLVNGKILVDGSVGNFAGTVDLRVAGNVEFRGNSEINATGRGADTDGGTVSIQSGGDIVLDGSSIAPTIQARSGDDSAGGTISLVAAGKIDVMEKVTADGGVLDGGDISIEAKGDISITKQVTADGSNGFGFGGTIDIISNGNVTVAAKVTVDGAPGTIENGSGDGGEITIFADRDLLINGQLLSQGGADGDGGDIDVQALGDIVVSQLVSADGRGSEAAGGSVALDGRDVTISEKVSADGGRGGGGFIDVFSFDDIIIQASVTSNGGGGGTFESGDGGELLLGAGDDILVSANMKARGSGMDGFGGLIDATAGELSAGGTFRQLSGIIEASGNSGGGGFGGSVDILGCVIEQSDGAVMEVTGASGTVRLASREQMTIGGAISADSSITLVYRTGSTPPTLLPTALLNPFAPATDVVASSFITGCPACGNGIVEVPEECDDGGQIQGDGCGENCRFECGNQRPDPAEDCDDGNRLDGDCCSSGCSFEAAGSACTTDGNECTIDQCDGTGGCLHLNDDGAACDDNLFCNGTDSCQAGACGQHSGDPCAGMECNTCQEAMDSCFDPVGTPCADDGRECTIDECDGGGACAHPAIAAGSPCTDDGNACTDDQCDGTGNCVHPNNSVPCDDGLFCNGVDTCTGGVCMHAGSPCPDTECSTCQENTDSCVDPAGTPCTDDTNECTVDQCDGAGVCAHPNEIDGTPCSDDGLFCTGVETCQGGGCVSSGNPCPGTQCNTCRENTDSCFDPAGTGCDDGDLCTPADQCDGAGLCVAGGTTCGNGSVDGACGEECDDGGTDAGDGCDPDCIVEVCGNGKLQVGEECDDGNATPDDGCSPLCLQDIPLPLVPGGGSAKKDCGMALALDPVPPMVKGFPTTKVSCRENDPTCDFDSDRFQCTFHIWVCLNTAISGKPCVATARIDSFELKKPRPDRPKDAADANNVATLEGALMDLGVDIVRKKTVVFDGPGAVGAQVCTKRLDVVVPIRPGRPLGRRMVKAVAVGTTGGKTVKDADKLKLTCFR